jgi:hypothetical protein
MRLPACIAHFTMNCNDDSGFLPHAGQRLHSESAARRSLQR